MPREKDYEIFPQTPKPTRPVERQVQEVEDLVRGLTKTTSFRDLFQLVLRKNNQATGLDLTEALRRLTKERAIRWRGDHIEPLSFIEKVSAKLEEN